MSDSEVISILNKFSGILEINSAWIWPVKWIGWALIKMLAALVDLVAGVTDQLFVLDTFYKNSEVVAFIDSFKPLIWVLFALSLVGVGYRIMFTKNKDFQGVVINFVIALSVIAALPVAMDKMMDVTRAGVSFINTGNSGQEENYADKIIKDNVTDVLLYEKNGFQSTSLSKPNNIPIENIRGISATDSIDTDDIETDYEEVFKNKLAIGADGTKELVELEQGATDIFKEYYGRYKISYFYILISLAVVAATQVFTSIKLGRLIFELAYNQLLAMIVAPLDISSGQRIKKIIENMISIFFVTILISALLKFYIMFVPVASDLGGIAGVILLISGSFAVIDGPNIVEKLFGIDAGLQSGFKAITGTYAALKGAGMAANTVGNLASTGASAVGGVATAAAGGAGGLSGLGKGIMQGMSNENGSQDGVQSPVNSGEKGSREDSGDTGKNNSEPGIYSEMEMMENEENQNSEAPNTNEHENDERPSSLYEEMGGAESDSDTGQKDTPSEPKIQKPATNMASPNTGASPATAGVVSGAATAQNPGTASSIERPGVINESSSPGTGHIGGAAGQGSMGPDTQSEGSGNKPSQMSRPTISNETKPIGSPQSVRTEAAIQKPMQTNQNTIGSISEPIQNMNGDSSAPNISRPSIQDTESFSSAVSSGGSEISSPGAPPIDTSPVSGVVQKPEATKGAPMETVKETRTIEQALGEAVKSKMKSSSQYQALTKSYNLSLNTGKKIGEKIKK